MTKVSKIIIFLVLSLVSLQTLAEKVNKIQISGNHRIENSTIEEYLGIGIGDDISPLTKSDAIKNLYATSLFDDVKIDFQSGTLKVIVEETPFISKVIFKGNSKIKTNTFETELFTTAGESLKKIKLSADVAKIKEMYKKAGRHSARVKSIVEKQKNNRVKVIFEIDEGPKTGIKSINFVGNEHYKDSELKSIILTKESRWFRFLETNDTYDAERIEYDKYLLKQFYNSVGFADFRSISVTSELLPTKEGFILTYSIEEGKKYNFGKIDLVNKIKGIDDNTVLKFITNLQGKTFNANTIQSMTDQISSYLASNGYAQTEVTPEFKPDVNTGIVDVTIIIDESYKIFINRINIIGNLRTEDQVIRRQLKIAEGDSFSRNKIDRGEKNIRNLDYFSTMSLKIEPSENIDRYNINIDVEEKSTSYLGFDMGYNTSGGPFGKVSFVERNLVGSGKYLSTGIQAGRKSIYYYLGVTDPAFMEKDLSLGVNLTRSENGKGSGFANGEQNYSMSSTGIRFTLGYNITDDLSHELEYSIKKDELKTPVQSSSIFIREQMGNYVTSAINHSLTYDKTDSRIVPKNGYLISGTQEFAGLGGNTKYVKHDVSGKIFKSFIENKLTLSVSSTGGHIAGVDGKKIRISDRFNIGDYSLRGFANGGVGPRDIATKEGLGGQKFYTLSTELNFPLFLPKEFDISGSLFADAGSVWDADSITSEGFHNKKSIRASVGFGFTWLTRIAPIRVDWGFPIKKEKYDETQTFHIKFSTHF